MWSKVRAALPSLPSLSSLRSQFKSEKQPVLTSLLVIPVLTTYCYFQSNVFLISNAEGESMEPTIYPTDVLFIDKFFYKFNGLKKGDIVIAIQPVNPAINICKKIVEMPGGLVNGTLRVPPEHYWLEGDNKLKSYDSRHHGCVPENLIRGRVVFVLSI